LQQKDDPKYIPKEPHVNYQYHPEGHVELKLTGDNTVNNITATPCPTVWATDQELENVAGYRNATMADTDSNRPTMAVPKNTNGKATADVWE